MDVVSRHRPGPVSGVGPAVDPAEYVLTGAEPAPRPWVLPLVVGLGIVLGVVSVPVLMSLGGGGGAETVAAPLPSVSAGVTATVAVAAPTKAAAAAPSRAPRPSLSLAAPPPPAPPNTFTRASASASATRQANGDPGNRTAALEPTSGPAGRTVTISGRCEQGTDTRVLAGSTQAQKQDLAGDGSFRVDYQVPGSARSGSSVRLVARCLEANDVTTYQFDLLYRVTGTAIQVPGDLSGAGNLDAPDSAAVGDTFGVSGGGFMGGAAVIFQVRDGDTGKVLSSGRPTADGNGNVSVGGITVPGGTTGGHVQLVMAGLDPGGNQRVLVHVLTAG